MPEQTKLKVQSLDYQGKLILAKLRNIDSEEKEDYWVSLKASDDENGGYAVTVLNGGKGQEFFIYDGNVWTVDKVEPDEEAKQAELPSAVLKLTVWPLVRDLENVGRETLT